MPRILILILCICALAAKDDIPMAVFDRPSQPSAWELAIQHQHLILPLFLIIPMMGYSLLRRLSMARPTAAVLCSNCRTRYTWTPDVWDGWGMEIFGAGSALFVAWLQLDGTVGFVLPVACYVIIGLGIGQRGGRPVCPACSSMIWMPADAPAAQQPSSQPPAAT